MRKIIRYFTLFSMAILLLISCRIPQITQSIEQRQKTTITEQLVDTSIRIGADSLLSAFQYKIDSGQLVIKPLWQFGSSILENVLRIDSTNKMIYINTIVHDTFINVQYKIITKTDSVYIKLQDTQYITTNKLNGWQKTVQGFGYVFMGILLLIVIWGIAKVCLKIKQKIKIV